MIIFVDPHAGETGDTLDDSQLVRLFPAVNVLQQGRCVVAGNHYESVSRFERMMHWLQPVPCPRLRALAERVIENHGKVNLFRFVLRHSGFERLFIVGDDGKTLGGNAVPFRSISITTEGNTQFALVVRGENDVARDVFREGLLKNPPVNYLNRE